MHFGQEYFKTDSVSLVCSIKKHMMSVHPIIGDINFDHLIKVMFANFLQICVFLSSHWLQ